MQLNLEETKNKIYKILDDLGIIIEQKEEDFDLREYIQDSIQFISFIVNLEQELEIEIPDDMLLIESISSFNSFSNRIYDLLNS